MGLRLLTSHSLAIVSVTSGLWFENEHAMKSILVTSLDCLQLRELTLLIAITRNRA